LNIRDLEYLVAVHDVSNFSRAAELCNVSQSTLSGQLKKLEGNLGASLIERSTRRVLFTPMGESIVEYARGVLGGIKQIQTIARQSDDPMSGDFHFGLIPTVGPFLLPMFMPKLTGKYANTNLYLYELQADKLIEKLLKGELDAVILTKQDWTQPVIETPLYNEKLKLAVPSGHELAQAEATVHANALEGRSMLMLEDGHCLRDHALDVCFNVGANEDHRFKATSMDTLLHMVSSGAGVSLIPEFACDSSKMGIDYLDLDNSVPSREIVMLTRKKSARSVGLDTIASMIQSTVTDLQQKPLNSSLN